MSRVCKITGKRAQRGNNVSHAHNKTNKFFEVNLKKKRIFDPESGKWVTVRISARGLRTITKTGISKALRQHGLT